MSYYINKRPPLRRTSIFKRFMSDANYMSEAGLKKLQDEYNHRKYELRPEISEQISIAKEQGDLSENFEYQEAKDQQALNEKRIYELEEMIGQAVVVQSKSGGSEIAVGTAFVAQTASGEEKDFTIVGPTETDPMAGKISNESPLGKAFLGRQVGETIEVDAPSGKISYTIKAIT